MSVDEAALAMNLIHRFCEITFDHSWPSLLPVIGLLKTLLESPEDFWTEWLSATGGDFNRELRDQAVAFIQQPGFTGSLEDMQSFTRVKL
jgi:hypothetical protein